MEKKKEERDGDRDRQRERDRDRDRDKKKKKNPHQSSACTRKHEAKQEDGKVGSAVNSDFGL